MKVAPGSVERALVVSLQAPQAARRPALGPLCLLLWLLFSSCVLWGSAPLTLLGGLLLCACTGALLLQRDYRWALRIERGRLHLLRNGVPVFDASVLPEGEQRLLLQGQRVEALRCHKGEPPSYVFGLPRLHLAAADLDRVRERIEAEQQALEHTARQLELLDDPDVQAHVRGRLRTEERSRPSALRAQLQSLSQGRTPRAQAARALLAAPPPD